MSNSVKTLSVLVKLSLLSSLLVGLNSQVAVHANESNPLKTTSAACESLFKFSAVNAQGEPAQGYTETWFFTALDSSGVNIGTYLNVEELSTGLFQVCAPSPTWVNENFQRDQLPISSGDYVNLTFYGENESGPITQLTTHYFSNDEIDSIQDLSNPTISNLIISKTSEINETVKYQGEIYSGANFKLTRIVNLDSGQAEVIATAPLTSSGNISLSGLEDGSYELEILPSRSPSLAGIPIKTKFRFSYTGGTISWEDQNITDSLNVATGDFRASLKVLESDGSSRALTEAESNSLMFQCDGNRSEFIDTGSVLSDGVVTGNLGNYADGSDPVQFTICAMDPNLGLSDATFDLIKVNGELTASRNGVPQSLSELQLPEANFKISLQDTEGNFSSAYASATFSKASSDCLNEPFTHFSQDLVCENFSAWTRDGKLLTSLSDGDWWVVFDTYGQIQKSAPLVAKYRVTTSNGATQIQNLDAGAYKSGSSTINGGSQFVNLRAEMANFPVSVIGSDGNPLSNVILDLQFDFESEGMRSNRNAKQALYITSDQNGIAWINIAESGTYMAAAMPQIQSSKNSLARFTFEAVVDNQNQVLVSNFVSQQSVTGTIASNQQSLSIQLKQPNVTGTTKYPDGTLGKWQSIEFCKLDGSNNVDYSTCRHANSDMSGIYGIELDVDANYRVVTRPNFSTSVYTSGTYYINLNAFGEGCLLGETWTCSTLISPGHFDFSLSYPNVRGRIFVGEAPYSQSSNSWVSMNLSRYVSGSKDWSTSQWSNVQDGGNYAFNVLQTGGYVISTSFYNVPGYSDTDTYLLVSKNSSTGKLEFCEASPPETQFEDVTTCLDPSTKVTGNINLDISGARANLKVQVTYPAGISAYSYGQLNQLNQTEWGNNWNYSGGLQFNNAGVAYANLKSKNGLPAKYRLTITPQQSNSSAGQLRLAKKDINIWAGNFNGSLTDTEICLDNNFDSGTNLCNRNNGNFLDSEDTLSILIGEGNISGIVTMPGSTADPIPFANLHIEKWTPATWLQGPSNHIWKWAETWAAVDRNGKFGLQIDDPGVYKFTADKGWGSELPVSSNYALIKVNEDNTWCLLSVDSIAVGTATQYGSCVVANTNLNVQLTNPSVSGFVSYQNKRAPFSGGYAVLEKLVDGNYSYVAGTPLSSKGNFNFSARESGTYRVTVSPPTESRSIADSVQSNNFQVTCESTCVSSELALVFLSPNVVGTLCTATSVLEESCSKVPNAWISIRQKGDSISSDPTLWTYLSKGTSSSRTGEFSLTLPTNEIYALEINPFDPSRDGARRFVQLHIDSSGKCTTPSGLIQAGVQFSSDQSISDCSGLKIKFAEPNVLGTLSFDDNNKVMPWAWINVYDPATYRQVAWGNTNKTGGFALNIPDGSYSFDAYANYSVAAKPTLQLNLTITDGVLVSWKYRSSATNEVGEIINANFDHIEPNATVELIGLPSGFEAKKHVLVVEDNSESNGETFKTFVTSGGIVNKAKLYLSKDKTYKVTVIPLSSSGEYSNCVKEVVVNPTTDPGTLSDAKVLEMNCEPS